MKLKNKISYAKKQPRPGDIRVIKKFAWFPVILESDKGSKLWLEPYKVVQVYVNRGRYHHYSRGMYWRDHWLWGQDIYLPMDYPLNGRILVAERKRIKAEMKKNGER